MQETKTINILIDVDKKFVPKAEYVLRTFCRISGLQPKFFYKFYTGDIHLYYGKKIEYKYPVHIFHNQEAVAFYNQKESYPLKKYSFYVYNKELIPFLFSLKGRIQFLGKKTVFIRKDIISSAFYFLSCWQEYVFESHHPEETFRPIDSDQHHWDFADIPIVDCYLEIFERAINLIIPQFIPLQRWPNQKKYALSVSHNVDFSQHWFTFNSKQFFKNNRKLLLIHPISFLKRFFSNLKSDRIHKKPLEKIKKLINAEVNKGINSSFFLYSYSYSSPNSIDNGKESKYLKQIKTLFDKKEIGLLGDFYTSQNKEMFNNDINFLKKIKKNVNGYRSKGFNFSYQKMFVLLDERNIKYDSSMGYSEFVGYRCGTSYPFQPYNFENEKPFSVLEIPVIVKDLSLISTDSLKISLKKSKRILTELVQKTISRQGHISIVWNPEIFEWSKFNGWNKVYWKIVKKVVKKDGWLCSIDELYHYWINR